MNYHDGKQYAPLTPREKIVLRMRREGLPQKTAAYALGVSRGTIKLDTKHAAQKLGVKTAHAAVLVDLVMQEWLGEA